MNKDHLVRCSVSDCIHYDDNCCKASGIEVDGSHAKECTQTCCNTFTTSNTMTNSTQSSDHIGCTSIDCRATDCRHNDDCKCMLDSIEVNCTCEPNTCGTTEETCCSSFALK